MVVRLDLRPGEVWMHRILILCCLTIMLASCSVPSVIVAPVATATPPPLPILVYLRLVVTDQDTGQPVLASIWIDDKAYGPAAALEVTVPFTGEFLVKAQAPGYQEWKVVVKGQFLRDKDLEIPVRLIPTDKLL